MSGSQVQYLTYVLTAIVTICCQRKLLHDGVQMPRF